MEYRQLGLTGIEVPAIAFGCGPSAGLMINGTPAEQDEAIGRALDCGVTLFDTASVYGDGASEANLGRCLRRLAGSGNALLSTKFLVDWSDLDCPGKAVTRNVQASLHRLGVDHVDVFQMHNRVAQDPPPGAQYAIGPVLSVAQVLGPGGVADALDVLIADGVIRSAGFTTYGGEVGAIRELIDSGRFGMVNGEFNLLNPSAVHPTPRMFDQPDYGQVMAHSHDHGLGVAVIRALAGGALVEPGHKVHPLAEPRTRTAEHADNARRAAAVRQLLAGDERPLEHLAINYVLSRPPISTVVLGFSSAEQVDMAVSAVSPAGVVWQADDEVLAELHRTFSTNL